jgi:hypothetical protein
LFLKRDNLQLGLALGLVVPLLVVFIIYGIRFSNYGLAEYFEVLGRESRLLTFVSAWCLVANIGLFTLYINTERYNTAKGVFIITVTYGVLFLLTKVIM